MKKKIIGWVGYIAIILLLLSLIGLFFAGYTITEDKQIKKLIPSSY